MSNESSFEIPYNIDNLNVSEYITVEDIKNPEYVLPYQIGESVHIGYCPISEEEAIMSTYHLPMYMFSHIRISCEYSLNHIINCIRKFLWRNEMVIYFPRIRNVVPNYGKYLYKTNVMYESSKIVIIVYKLPSEYLIEMNRESGKGVSMKRMCEVFERYVVSKGEEDPKM